MSKKILTILEHDNGFVMPYKKIGGAQGNGVYLKNEVLMMIKDLNPDDIKVVVVKVDRIMTLEEYKQEKK